MSSLIRNHLQIGYDADPTKNYTFEKTDAGLLIISQGSIGGTLTEIARFDADGQFIPAKGGYFITGSSILASGTSFDFDDVPANVKEITLSIALLSTTGTSRVQIQLGTSGGLVTTGYQNAVTNLASNTPGSDNGTGAGFTLLAVNTAAVVTQTGNLILTRQSTDRWVLSGVLARTDTGGTWVVGGSVALSGPLSKIRFTTILATESFDTGRVDVFYKG